jgi:hypothetical protein
MKRGKNNKAKRIVKLINYIEEMLDYNIKTFKDPSLLDLYLFNTVNKLKTTKLSRISNTYITYLQDSLSLKQEKLNGQD